MTTRRPVPGERVPRGWAPWARVTAFGLLLVGAAVVVTATGAGDLGSVRDRVTEAGPLAPVLFTVAYAAVTLAPLPKNALSAGAGLIFGLTTGVTVVWAGAMLGAIAAFWLARALGRDTVERLTGGRVERLDALLRRRGRLGVLVARLVPVLPFTAVNYGSGLSSVGFADYLAGTAVGIVPGTVAYVALGTYGGAPLSWQFVAALTALLGLTVGAAVWARRARSGSAQ